MLEIKDLAVQYGHHDPTIEHFNLSMKKGEIISPRSGTGYFRRYPLSRGISSEKFQKRLEKDPWQQDVNDLPGLWRNPEPDP